MAQEPIQELKRTEQLKGGVQSGDFIGEFSAIARSTNQLGELGASIAQQSSLELNKQMGYEAGLNPKGNVFAGFGKSADAYKASYNASAQSTLGLEGHKALLKSQVEMQSLNRISQDNIHSYAERNSQMISDVLKNAPNDIKNNLRLQLNESLINSTAKLQVKLATQQHQDTVNEANSYNKTALVNIYESAFSGEDKTSKALVSQFIEHNERNKEGFIIRGDQLESLKSQAKITYWSGILNKDSNKMINENRFAELKSNLNDIKMEGLNESEQQSVKENVIKHIKFAQELKVNSQSELYSDMSLKIAGGTDYPDDWTNAKHELSPTNYNKLAKSKLLFSSKKNKHDSELIAASRDFKTTKLGSYSKDVITEVFNEAVNAKLKENPAMDEPTAKAEVAITAGTPIKSYVDSINRDILTGNSDLAASASATLKVFQSQNKGQLLNITEKAKAKLGLFDSFHDTGGVSAEEAYQKATESTNLDSNLLKSRNEEYAEYSSDNLSDTSSKAKKARNLFGLTNFPFGIGNTPLTQQNVMSREALTLHHNYFNLTGSIDVADKLTSDALAVKYQPTSINGGKEQSLMPITSKYENSPDWQRAIWSDASNDISQSFSIMKKQFDKGDVSYYYEFDKDSQSIPPKVIKHFRNKATQNFQLRIDTPAGGVTQNGNQYEITLQNNQASNLLFDLLPLAANGKYIYISNDNRINENFITQKRKDKNDLSKALNEMEFIDIALRN